MIREQVVKLQEALAKSRERDLHSIDIMHTGEVISLDSGIAVIRGLQRLKNLELVEFGQGTMGMAFNLDPDSTGIIMLGDYDHIQSGARVRRTHRVATVPVSPDFIGRVISPLGVALDGQGPIVAREHWEIEREAPPIMHRDPVVRPLQTGIKVVDSVVPIGRGQRELIVGDRQTGKTAIAVDTILNQKDEDVVCIYCAIGQQMETVAKTVGALRDRGAMSYTVVMVAGSDDAPGVAYMAPYAATSLGEYFMAEGQDVLIIYDDLTRHARAYRQLSLLLERPPGREAYPGDIFYIHSRLLERATQMRQEYGGGSLTALPIIETQAENISAYIPTNLISITDGQIYLSPKLFQKGNLPAVQIGTSVSRVGGKTQLPAYRDVTSALKLTYSQFEELEVFASFGTRLDENTRRTLDRGMRIREILTQAQYNPMPVTEQIGVLLAATRGALDGIALDRIGEAETILRELVRENKDFREIVMAAKQLSREDKDAFLAQAEERLKPLRDSDDE